MDTNLRPDARPLGTLSERSGERTRNLKPDTGNSPAISVIVPVYNAEKTIRKCVDSLLAQTFQDFEILLIDDGSPDQCGAICDEYAKQDNRVRVIHQENQGVSAARQCGIDLAQGEYTIHADPDDWVEPEMLKELYQKAREDDADMVICDFYINTYKGQNYLSQKPSSLQHDVVLKELFKHLHGSCCNKLIKLSCYKKWNIQFPLSLSRCEDQYVIASLLLRDIKVSYLPAAFYHYFRNNDNTLSRFYSEKTHLQDIQSRDFFYELLKNTNLAQMVYEKKSYTIFASAFWGGKDSYSSSLFESEFASYETIVRKVESSFFNKLLMVIACRGGYQFVICFAHSFLSIKQLFYSSFLNRS